MPIRHTVRQGECLTEIAEDHGFHDPQVVWQHSGNDGLREHRPNPNNLMPGDVVEIPDREEKSRSLAVDQNHRVTVRQPKKELRLVLRDGRGEPLASTAYTLSLRGRDPVEGQTDGDGLLTEKIPLRARSAELRVDGRVIRLRLGHLNPTRQSPDDGATGIQARLANLGYDVGAIDGDVARRTRMAIAMFQLDRGLEITGEVDDALRDELEGEHGV